MRRIVGCPLRIVGIRVIRSNLSWFAIVLFEDQIGRVAPLLVQECFSYCPRRDLDRFSHVFANASSEGGLGRCASKPAALERSMS
jgi:hypothetical protein